MAREVGEAVGEGFIDRGAHGASGVLHVDAVEPSNPAGGAAVLPEQQVDVVGEGVAAGETGTEALAKASVKRQVALVKAEAGIAPRREEMTRLERHRDWLQDALESVLIAMKLSLDLLIAYMLRELMPSAGMSTERGQLRLHPPSLPACATDSST